MPILPQFLQTPRSYSKPVAWSICHSSWHGVCPRSGKCPPYIGMPRLRPKPVSASKLWITRGKLWIKPLNWGKHVHFRQLRRKSIPPLVGVPYRLSQYLENPQLGLKKGCCSSPLSTDGLGITFAPGSLTNQPDAPPPPIYTVGMIPLPTYPLYPHPLLRLLLTINYIIKGYSYPQLHHSDPLTTFLVTATFKRFDLGMV